MNPKVSIILPTYNGTNKGLAKSIESCLNQSYRNIELIVVDDCSTDNTSQIVASYQDSRIKYIRNTTNQRLPRSLNIGFQNATGEYLTWTSDDNEFLPTAIEEMLTFLQKNPEIDFVYTDLIVRYFETGETKTRKFSDLNLAKENNMGACYLYTKKVYQTIGDYDPRFEWVEDYDYWIRIDQKFQIRHYAKPLYIYGDHLASLTSTRRYPIVMMRDILRYWYGYLSIREFQEAIRQFSVDVRQHIKKPQEQLNAWKQVFSKVFGISVSFGLFFITLFIYLSIKKIINSLLKPFINLLRSSFEKQRLQKTIAQLQKTKGNKNVLCLIPHMVVGGSEKVLWDVVKGLKPHGYHFHLLCNKKEKNEWCHKFSAEFENVILLNESAEDREYQEYLPQIIRKLDIDLLLNTNSRVGYRCLPQLKEEFINLKFMDIVHLEHVGGSIEKYSWIANYLDRRVCISHHLKEYIKIFYKQNNISESKEEKLEVIYNSISEDYGNFVKDSNQFRTTYTIPTETKIVSFIGRFASEKNPFLFIDIARTLLNNTSKHSWKFVMAGNGPYLEKIKTRIKECDLEKHFILPGMLNDVSELLAASFTLLVTSQHEGIPLVIQEAFALKIPVISTNVGAIKELIQEGKNGYLVNLDENTIDQFHNRIVHLANNSNLYSMFSSQARTSLFPKFSQTIMEASYKKIFDDLLIEVPKQTITSTSDLRRKPL